MLSLKFIAPLSLVALLVGCGGGSSKGGGSNSPAPTVPSSIATSSTAPSSIAPSSTPINSSALSSQMVLSSTAASSENAMNSSSTGSNLTFSLTSTNFANADTIPAKYTCDGQNINPQLHWENAPESTQSFAVIMDDPDANSVVGYTWVHWNVYNMAANTTEIKEGASTHADLMPLGSIESATSFGSAKYGGPCPPSGKHHYYLVIYALNKSSITAAGASTRATFEANHAQDIISSATLTGYYR